jgi:hypothetical protein
LSTLTAFGVAAETRAAYSVVWRIMQFDFVFDWPAALAAAAEALRSPSG